LSVTAETTFPFASVMATRSDIGTPRAPFTGLTANPLHEVREDQPPTWIRRRPAVADESEGRLDLSLFVLLNREQASLFDCVRVLLGLSVPTLLPKDAIFPTNGGVAAVAVTADAATTPTMPNARACRTIRRVGTARFERAASATQTQRSDQAELRPETISVRARAEEARVAAMVDSPYLPAEGVRTARAPRVGYLMVMGAAVLFAINGTVAKVVLESGVTSLRLTQARCAGALIGLGLIVLLTRPSSLRTTRRELAFLVVFGVCGVALVQLFYFAAIARLEIGVSLLIQYTAPLLVALWARFVFKERVRSRVWAALALALVGLSVMVDVWGGVPLNTAGVVLSFISAATFAAYLLLAEHAVGRRDPLSLLVYGFLFASLFWAVAQPWWSFPRDELGETISLLGNLGGTELPAWVLVLAIVVVGTIIPFTLMVGSLQHLPATTVGMVAMLEPVIGALVAYVWLDESLAAQQLVGGAIVLTAIFLAQSSRD
jgi:drug/metabolite transporter (DMT)-like permease